MSASVWVTPDAVELTAAEVAAALLAYSGLRQACPDPTPAALRGEVGYLLARYGTEGIRRATGLAGPQDPRWPWCWQQAVKLTAPVSTGVSAPVSGFVSAPVSGGVA